MYISVLFSIFFIQVFGFGPLCNNYNRSTPVNLVNGLKAPAAPVKIAFIGDQGISEASSAKVLELVKNWGANPLVILGDFDYRDSPYEWQRMMDTYLGPDFPVLAVGGNHDVPAWSGYQNMIERSLSYSGLSQYCTGTPGYDMVCDYQGIVFFLNQVGTAGLIDDFVTNTENNLKAYQSRPWKFCGWHKNQALYQTGDKSDETGYEILDTCRRYGAVVMTAHEHSYSRSVLMDDFATQTISDPRQVDDLQLSNGQSFVTVTGLGGYSLRPWLYGAENYPWWAFCGATNNGINYGALLCTIDTNVGSCELTDITGKVWEKFNIRPPINPDGPVPEASKCAPRFTEIGAEEDAHQIGSFIFHESETISLSEPFQTFAVRFENVPLAQFDRIKSIHLQVFGFGPSSGETEISIKAELVSNSVSLSNVLLTDRKTTVREVTWTKDDGLLDWESGQVWISPNLKEMIEEVVQQPNWQSGNALTLIVQGKGSARHIFTRNHGDCFAPTLSISLGSSCT